MKMRKMMLTIVVIMITAISMFGQAQTAKQPKKSPEERTEKIVAKMKIDLALSDDQVSKLKPVILKREQQRSEMYAKMDTAKSDTRRVMKGSEDKFKKILTPEQYVKLKQQRKEMHDKRREMHEDMRKE